MRQSTETAPQDTDGLFARARAGDQLAWQALFDACSPKVLRVIRRRLNSPAMRSIYDSTDFASDVWKSLAEKQATFDFPTLNHLIAFLSTAAEQKVIDEHRRLSALKRDVGRNRPLEAWRRPGGGEPDLPSGDPTASQEAQAIEVERTLLEGQDGDQRRIIELKRQDYTTQEVAEQTGWSVRSVQRFLKGLSDSWIARSGGRP